MVGIAMVGGLVAVLPQLVEQAGGVAWDGTAILQAAQQVDLVLADITVATDLRGYALGERFPELTQLDQGGVGVTPEVTLGHCAQRHELGGVDAKEPEVGRGYGQG